ncbi:hypothetical protein BV378_11845 [Nostoc sp. RF31YmG]|nr:hypothetical protein BV378_11845 [Nostoc sp. RF31YmG]
MDKAAEDLFEKFALKQHRDLENLRAVRGYHGIEDWGGSVTCSSVARVLSGEGGLDYWPRTGILIYAHEESQLYSWLIDERGLLAYHLEAINREELEQRIQEQRSALGVERLQESRAPVYRKLMPLDQKPQKRPFLDNATDNLSKILFSPPIASALKDIKHLIVVPVYSLGVVPFAMLKPFANKDVLIIEHMSVSIAPSLFDIEQLLEEVFTPRNRGFTFESPLVAGLSEFPQRGKYHFSPLPGVKKEVEAVAKELEVSSLLDSQATKEVICAEAEHSDLVYIATHGFADENEGYLVLWPRDDSDGIWSGQEIHDVRFNNAYVAVLSACQTGLGQVHDAGIIGVARSFQMGGVPRVIVSLWSVKDEETAIFMVRLVRNMRQMMVAEALRQTVLEMRRDYPDPTIWASFSFFGTPR